jgi:murein DD-endopeptidase MepM/ murein hydrolase activator NlpD
MAPALVLRKLTRLVGLTLIVGLTIQLAAPIESAASVVVSLWRWPVEGSQEVFRPFVAPATPYAAGHRGIDLVAEAGTTVYAVADGIVYFAGTVVDRPVLSIRHSGELISSYEPVQTTLTAGATVHSGDVIGQVVSAPTGHCVVSCLHLGVRVHGHYVSPLNYLGGIPRSVLLPTRPLH